METNRNEFSIIKFIFLDSKTSKNIFLHSRSIYMSMITYISPVRQLLKIEIYEESLNYTLNIFQKVNFSFFSRRRIKRYV